MKAAVTSVKDDLVSSEKQFPSKCVTSLSRTFAPLLEDFPDLMTDDVQQYHDLIVQIKWAVYIERLDILLVMLLLSSNLAMPLVGHLEQEFHFFGYLKAHPKRNLSFDPEHLAINEKRFQYCDWMKFYRDAEEAIFGNIPVERGNFISTQCFVDANQSGDTGTRLFHTSILFVCNSAPIIWFSKNQNSVEASTFG